MRYITPLMCLTAASLLLAGCGGSSSDSELGTPAQIFSLSDYDNSNVSTQSLTGTWVSVSTMNSSAQFEGIESTGVRSERAFFIIKQDGDDLKMGVCNASVSYNGLTTITVADNSFTDPNDRVYTIDNNRHLSITDYSVNLFGAVGNTASEAIKISDSTEGVGSLQMNFSNGDGDESINAVCAAQGFGAALINNVSLSDEIYTVEFEDAFSNFQLSSDSHNYKEIEISGSDFDSRINGDNSEEGNVDITESTVTDTLNGFSKSISASDSDSGISVEATLTINVDI